MSLGNRIGVLVSSTNTTCEVDQQMVVPRRITVHGQRPWLTKTRLMPDERHAGFVRMGACRSRRTVPETRPSSRGSVSLTRSSLFARGRSDGKKGLTAGSLA